MIILYSKGPVLVASNSLPVLYSLIKYLTGYNDIYLWTTGSNKTSNFAVQTDTNDFERSVAPRLRDVVCTSRTRNNRRGSTVFHGMLKQPIERRDRYCSDRGSKTVKYLTILLL